jgi:NitT/TauT family transport system substrate-binding protein
MTATLLRRAIAPSAALLLFSGLAACSSDDDPIVTAPASTAGATASAEPSSSAAPEVSDTKVHLGFSAWPGWFPWQVAEEKGLFEANGVDVDLTYFDSYTDSLNALAAQKLDANSQTLNDTLSSVSGGAKEVVVLTNDNSTGNDQIIASSDIDSVADLKGKKVAAEQGTVDHYLLLLALEKAGLTEDDIDFVPLVTDAAAAAFAAGRVDAVGAFAPFTTTALEREGSHAITSSEEFPGAIPDHLVFTQDFVNDHPDEVQAVVDTWFDTLDYIQDHPDESVAILAKRAGVSEEEYKEYAEGTTIFDAQQNADSFVASDAETSLPTRLTEIAEFLVRSGLVDDKPSTEGVLDDRFAKAALAARKR